MKTIVIAPWRRQEVLSVGEKTAERAKAGRGWSHGGGWSQAKWLKKKRSLTVLCQEMLGCFPFILKKNGCFFERIFEISCDKNS